MNLGSGSKNLKDSFSTPSEHSPPDEATSVDLKHRKKLRDPKFISFSSRFKPKGEVQKDHKKRFLETLAESGGLTFEAELREMELERTRIRVLQRGPATFLDVSRNRCFDQVLHRALR